MKKQLLQNKNNFMLIEKENVKKDGISCNFCNRRKIIHGVFFGPIGLDYPYQEVYTICRDNTSGVKVSICPDCIKELTEKIKICW